MVTSTTTPGSMLMDDLLDGLRWRVKVDDTLVDAHLEPVVGVGTLTTRRLAGHDPQSLGRHADRALAHETLVLDSLDEVSADLLESLDVAGCEVDANLVDALLLSLEGFCC